MEKNFLSYYIETIIVYNLKELSKAIPAKASAILYSQDVTDDPNDLDMFFDIVATFCMYLSK